MSTFYHWEFHFLQITAPVLANRNEIWESGHRIYQPRITLFLQAISCEWSYKEIQKIVLDSFWNCTLKDLIAGACYKAARAWSYLAEMYHVESKLLTQWNLPDSTTYVFICLTWRDLSLLTMWTEGYVVLALWSSSAFMDLRDWGSLSLYSQFLPQNGVMGVECPLYRSLHVHTFLRVYFKLFSLAPRLFCFWSENWWNCQRISSYGAIWKRSPTICLAETYLNLVVYWSIGFLWEKNQFQFYILLSVGDFFSSWIGFEAQFYLLGTSRRQCILASESIYSHDWHCGIKLFPRHVVL